MSDIDEANEGYHRGVISLDGVSVVRASADEMRTSAANIEAGLSAAPRAGLVTNEQPVSFTGVPIK
ncbi:hypothetical protein MSG28_001951 [Choristoneura fumiferana]|uniref:Uncharacterized protein n=1 Tax=Choristoneura fumiferana TaxID=7141 RepID=A0ACC0JTG6_CHOFU|nr:hypothetical protein MSG28_001951 [Choristoneura fumiferana]